jgi:hypothetical protein
LEQIFLLEPNLDLQNRRVEMYLQDLQRQDEGRKREMVVLSDEVESVRPPKELRSLALQVAAWFRQKRSAI